MIFVLLIISVTLNVLLVAVLWNHRKSVKESVEQVRRVNESKSQMKLKNYSTEKGYGELMREINQLLEKYNQTKIYYKQTTEQNKRMIASISHDFRTPLTSMLGYIQLLQEDISAEKREHYRSIIEERTNNLTNLVNEFYLLSLLDSETYELDLEKVNPIIQVQERVALYYTDLENTFSHLSIELEEEPIEINTSIVDFNRIVDNIVQNAMGHGTDSFKLSNHVENEKIRFVFSNEVAHPESIQVEQVFERLYKADHSRTKGSTGLGMAIAKELSEKLGYDLEVELSDSIIQFTLTLPL